MADGPTVADELVLAGEFPAADREQWLAAVAAALDRTGALSPDAALERLRATTYDGITLEPLYTADDAPDTERPAIAGHGDGWDVRQRVDAAGPGRAVGELERGATSILLDVTGLATVDSDALARALDGVLLDVAPVALQAGERWQEAADALLTILDGVDAESGAGSLGADPVGAATLAGSADGLDEQLDAVAALYRRLGADRPALRVVTVDGTRFHDAGASDGQELGCTIAAAVEYLRALDARGVDTADAIGRIELRLAATGDQFATIAKLRAVRVLWERVADVVGAPQAANTTPLHAVTSTAMMTSYDPWVNALRSTVACFAAGVGGADAVTVLPHDHLQGSAATELGRRVGRNTQSILLRESHLAEVTDPAAGSWYVERFTAQLAAAAWAWFQEIEAAGGLVAAASNGLVAERLAATHEARRRDIDTRRAPLTGLTEFPNIDEPPPPGDDQHPFRWAAEIEALRRRVDRVAAATGQRPAVFLATIGTPATFTPRVTFARNFFEVGGLGTVQGPVTDDAAEIAASFAATGATVACLCSSDPAYAAHAGEVGAALDAAGATAVLIAGQPQAGIDRAIHMGVDVRATLTDVLELLQVP